MISSFVVVSILFSQPYSKMSESTKEPNQEEDPKGEEMSEDLKSFYAEIEKKKERAARFETTYEMSSEDKTRLRLLKFGKKPLDEPSILSSSKKRKGKSAVVVDLEDPVIKRRLEKFGKPPKGSSLAKAIDSVEDKEKKEQRKKRFEES